MVAGFASGALWGVLMANSLTLDGDNFDGYLLRCDFISFYFDILDYLSTSGLVYFVNPKLLIDSGFFTGSFHTL